MIANNYRRLSGRVLAILLGILVMSCGGGGGTNVNEDPNAPSPQIFGLDKSSANVGDPVTIVGSNFGDAQGSGTVTLNGTSFTVNAWTKTQISATVVSGMSSGIVTVQQNGKSSQNGQEAQLYIGAAPTGNPLVYSLSPDYGRKGEDEILVTGINFGSYRDDPNTGVFFSADAAVSALGYVKAQVSIDPVSNLPRWTNTSIRVIVPSNATTGDMYVMFNGVESNHKSFEAQPPAGPTGDPVITNFTPANGPVGTQVTIQGNNFGNSQGNSTASINGIGLGVMDWTNTQILATIPAGATTGAFTVTVGGKAAVSGTNFIVANSPIVTGVAPTSMRVGQSLTIYGNFFGFSQGSGNLQVGSTTVTVSSWNNTTITVDLLPGINAADPNSVPIVVTNDAGLSSLPFLGKLVSDITGLVTVKPKAGVAGKTAFKFNCSASGGSGNYEYTLIPNSSSPGETKTGALPISYVYDNQGSYATAMKIVDKSTGDQAIITGPTVTVVGPNDMVITEIEMLDFGGPEPAENTWSRIYEAPTFTNILYNDFVFFQGVTWFTTPLADLFSGPTKLPAFERDQANFMADGTLARPVAYRHGNGSGSTVRIHGFNFGTQQGNIYLNSSAPAPGDPVKQVPSLNIASWGAAGSVEDQDELIDFILPAAAAGSLSGFVVVERTDNGKSAKSVDPLICSALVTDHQPPSVALDGTLQVTGYDFTAPALEGVSGSETKLFWVVNAQYTDPFTSSSVTRLVTLVHPFDASVAGTLISFSMSDLDSDGDTSNGVTNDIEAYSADGSQYQVVTGATLVPGDYQFFLWTGADTSNGSSIVRANSGVFSDPITQTVTAVGGGGGGGPTANLSANPTNGSAPLAVAFNAASSSATPPATLVAYRFDYTDDGSWDQDSPAANANFVYNTNGTYTCRLEVEDSDGATDQDTVVITVGGGGGGNLEIFAETRVLFESVPLNDDPDLHSDPLPGVPCDARTFADVVVSGPVNSDANGIIHLTGVPSDPSGLKIHLVNALPPSGDA